MSLNKTNHLVDVLDLVFPHETTRRRRRAQALDLGTVRAFRQWGKIPSPHRRCSLVGDHSAGSELRK